ncbi:membrane protein [Streptococcus varani]|uniref:Membrane protein n=1 Tax=Streptococcus varani TaxID=1608583 RepID=A0A0E4CSY2_9STRE|nr:hypothetical protein [Streptococcus varani]CQR25078.1 membrane protein [Streptococcus varani]
MMKRLLNFGNTIFFTMTVFWLYFAFRYAFEFVSIDLVTMTPITAGMMVIVTIMVFLTFTFKQYVFSTLKKIYELMVDHKAWVLALLTFFQIFILFTSGGLARADTTILYQLATDPNFAKESIYISNYPNNFLFLIYLKVIFRISPENLVFNLSLLNIFFVNASLMFSYQLVKEYFQEYVANSYFILYILLFALQPQFIYTYTDPITLFFVVLLCVVLSYLVKNWENQKIFYLTSLGLGLVISVCYNLRPPTVIYVLALFVVLISVKRKTQFSLKKIATVTLIAFSMFYVSNKSLNLLLEKQDFVLYKDNYSRNLLYYVDLGLTYGGNYHHEIPQEIVAATNDNLNDLVKKDIKRRLDDYTTESFIGHLYYKYYWITGEGMFGWYQEQVLSEESTLQMPWIQGIMNAAFARKIRTIIYATGQNFKIQAIFFQMIWIVTVIGVLIYSFLFKSSPYHIALWLQITLFGGFLFLMIFEGGRTRYLIQFLPPIILLSSLGWEQMISYFYQVKKFNLSKKAEL